MPSSNYEPCNWICNNRIMIQFAPNKLSSKALHEPILTRSEDLHPIHCLAYSSSRSLMWRFMQLPEHLLKCIKYASQTCRLELTRTKNNLSNAQTHPEIRIPGQSIIMLELPIATKSATAVWQNHLPCWITDEFVHIKSNPTKKISREENQRKKNYVGLHSIEISMKIYESFLSLTYSSHTENSKTEKQCSKKPYVVRGRSTNIEHICSIQMHTQAHMQFRF